MKRQHIRRIAFGLIFALTASPLVMAEEAAKALRQGYPIAVGSQVGFGTTRDKDGFLNRSGTWGRRFSRRSSTSPTTRTLTPRPPPPRATPRAAPARHAPCSRYARTFSYLASVCFSDATLRCCKCGKCGALACLRKCCRC